MAKKGTPEIPGLFDDLPDDSPQEQIAKIKLRNWRDHLSRLGALEKTIEQLMDDAVKATLRSGKKLSADDIGKVFQANPALRKALDNAMESLTDDLTATIEQGSKEAWLRANASNDAVIAAMAAGNSQLAALFASEKNKPQNDRALRAFQRREVQGMKLSERVWKTTEGFKLDMERAIEVSLAEGVPAQKLSMRVRQLLREPNRLYRRVRDKDGNLVLSKAAQAYHPGTGVYRSSYKNAMRLARTEVNMAYHASDHERWSSSWWVRGIRIKLSNNHTMEDSKGRPAPLVDICDELQGDYPSDFHFMGWHPQCRCIAVPLTTDYATIRDYYRRKRAGEDMSNYTPPGQVTQPPEQFKQWLATNKERLEGAAQRGTTPYFVRDNAKYTDPNWKPSKPTQAPPPKKTPLDIANERHAARTAEQERELQFKWSRRRLNRMQIDLSKLSPADIARYDKMLEMTSYANLANFNVGEFNANYAVIKRHSQRTTQQIKKIRKQWDARCIAQAGETAKVEAMRKAIELQEITAISDVDRIMQEYYAQFPEEFNNHKIRFISFTRAPSGGSYTLGYSKHNIEIAFNDYGGKKNPTNMLIAAMEKVRTGKKLTLDQHRAVETVVHELLHQKAGKHVVLKRHGEGDYKRTSMETMNELAARATTVRFLRRMGANTDGVSQLIKNGDGYGVWVSRVLEVCEKANINPEFLGQQWAKTLATESYDTMDVHLYNFLKANADKKSFTQTMDEALAIFEDESYSGTKNWQDAFKKWFP